MNAQCVAGVATGDLKEGRKAEEKEALLLPRQNFLDIWPHNGGSQPRLEALSREGYTVVELSYVWLQFHWLCSLVFFGSVQFTGLW